MKWVLKEIDESRSWSSLPIILWTIAFAEIGLLVSIGSDSWSPRYKEDSIYLQNAGFWKHTHAMVIELCRPFPWQGCFLPIVGGLLRSRGRLVPTLAIIGGSIVGFWMFLPTLLGTHTGREYPLYEKAIPGLTIMTLAVVVPVVYAAAFSSQRKSKSTT